MSSQIVTVFKNGDSTFAGKRLVVNKRQIRTMGALLDKVTKDTRMKQAARSIKTPTGRHTINQLDSLETGGCYVAMGNEKFVPLAYKEIKDIQIRSTPRKEIEITPVKHSPLRLSGRHRKVAEAQSHSHKTIHVFRNGDDLYPSVKMLLDRRELGSMDSVLRVVTKKVRLQSGAVYWLFTMEGKELRDPSELENGGQYVAVGHGKKFKRLAYSDDTMLSPRSRAQTKTQIKDSNSRSNRSNRTKSQNTISKNSKRKSSSTSNSQASSLEDYSARKPIEEFQEAITEEVQEEFISQPPGEVFSKSPDKLLSQVRDKLDSPLRERSPSPQESHQGVYQASGENQEKAREVQDDREIKEDKPIDQLPAQEVEEEEVVEPEPDNTQESLNEDKNTKETKDEVEKENSGFGGFIEDLVDNVRERLDDSDDENAKKDDDAKKENTSAANNETQG